MCRLLALNRSAFEWLVINGERDYLSPYLAQLIKSNGGDGNGVAALYPVKGEIAYRKSLYLLPEDATEWLLDAYLQGAEQFLFHTRYASFGAVCAENCHPFYVNGTVLAHNGHDTRLVLDARKHGYTVQDMPDSHAATFLAAKFGPSYLEQFSGNFLGWRHGKFFCVVGQGHWPMYKLTASNGGIFHCSEVPRHISTKAYQTEDLRPYVEPTYIPAWWYADGKLSANWYREIAPSVHFPPLPPGKNEE